MKCYTIILSGFAFHLAFYYSIVNSIYISLFYLAFFFFVLVLHYHTRNTLDFSTLFFLSTPTPNINHHTLLFFALPSNYPLLTSVLPYHPPPRPPPLPPPSSSPHKRIRRSSRTTNPISHTLLQEEEGECSITHTTIRRRV